MEDKTISFFYGLYKKFQGFCKGSLLMPKTGTTGKTIEISC
jgi:hypothetical protein